MIPENVLIDNSLNNDTAIWTLSAFEDSSELSYSPKVIVDNTMTNSDLEAASFVHDGRNTNDLDYESLSPSTNYICGSVVTKTSDQQRKAAKIRVVGSQQPYSYTASQYSASFISSSISDKRVSNVHFQFKNLSSIPLRNPPIATAATCKYDIISGSTQAAS